MAQRRELVKHYPTSYVEALAMLNGKDGMKIDNNTWLEHQYNTLYSPREVIGIRLHSTYVVTFYNDEGTIELNSGGYHSVTTKSRINAVLPAGIGVVQENYEWYLINWKTNIKHSFFDGITVGLVA